MSNDFDPWNFVETQKALGYQTYQIKLLAEVLKQWTGPRFTSAMIVDPDKHNPQIANAWHQQCVTIARELALEERLLGNHDYATWLETFNRRKI